MAGDLGTLATRMAALRAAIPGYANAKKVEVARAVHEHLITNTPVDTGQAMSNWDVTLNAPAVETNPPFVPSPRGFRVDKVWYHTVDPESTRAANIPMAQEERELALADSVSGDTVFISNNLPYIKRLDEGSSTQAPEGFTDAALIVGTQKFEAESEVTLTY
ncbi:MAG: hypothetical protein WAN50_00285 [Minisyncoccia bacterium]